MLSVVIPTYNEEEYLPRLLASLRDQAFRDFEVIVADSHSIDHTRDIAAKFGARVVDGGRPGVGRNRGAAVARGDAILFLDADVVLPDSGFLQTTLAEFRERGLGIATCRVDPMSARPVDRIFHGIYNAFMTATARFVPHAPGFCIFVRKTVHDAISGFDEAITLAEDHDYAARAGKTGRFGVLKSYKVPVSVRRFDRDGRLNTAVKFLLCELHMRTCGKVTTNVFNYTFGHNGKVEK